MSSTLDIDKFIVKIDQTIAGLEDFSMMATIHSARKCYTGLVEKKNHQKLYSFRTQKATIMTV